MPGRLLPCWHRICCTAWRVGDSAITTLLTAGGPGAAASCLHRGTWAAEQVSGGAQKRRHDAGCAADTPLALAWRAAAATGRLNHSSAEEQPTWPGGPGHARWRHPARRGHAARGRPTVMAGRAHAGRAHAGRAHAGRAHAGRAHAVWRPAKGRGPAEGRPHAVGRRAHAGRPHEAAWVRARRQEGEFSRRAVRVLLLLLLLLHAGGGLRSRGSSGSSMAQGTHGSGSRPVSGAPGGPMPMGGLGPMPMPMPIPIPMPMPMPIGGPPMPMGCRWPMPGGPKPMPGGPKPPWCCAAILTRSSSSLCVCTLSNCM
jgi:hypothetical protein